MAAEISPRLADAAIDARVKGDLWDLEIQARDLPYERKYTEKAEGLKLYADQPMKVELITERA